MKKIYIGAGCFWGVEEYFSYITGVISTKVGFANGFLPNPDYKSMVENPKGYAECCEITYDESIVSLKKLLEHLFKIINPTFIENFKYRSGIYWVDINDKDIALNFIQNQQKNYKDKIIVEVGLLTTFFLAKKEHQQYLKKNPNGYCHVPQKLIDETKKGD